MKGMDVTTRQVVQRCPNCSAKYDVGIYVSGQKVRCRRCGIKFAVVRSDTQIGPADGAGPHFDQYLLVGDFGEGSIRFNQGLTRFFQDHGLHDLPESEGLG